MFTFSKDFEHLFTECLTLTSNRAIMIITGVLLKMKNVKIRMRQLVDWGAAFWAGLISGVISFALILIISGIVLGSPWYATRLEASILLGSSILPPPTSFDLGIFVAALFVHLALAILFTFLVAAIVHKFGIVISVIGGALIGLALYGINYYSLSYFFPWFYQFRSWMFLVEHIVFGAIAGGLYELFEVEVFVPEGSK